MDFLKRVYQDERENVEKLYSVVDIYNKKKYRVSDYFKFLTNLGEDEFYLAEIPLYPVSLIIDVDIKSLNLNDEKLYNDNCILEIIHTYVQILDEFLVEPHKEYIVFLLEKPARIVDGFKKNGFHLHFISISLDKEDSKYVHTLAKERSEFCDYLDDITSKPWLIYGAQKSPDDNPYKITKTYKIFDGSIDEINYRDTIIGTTFSDIEITDINIDKMMKLIMSVRSSNLFSLSKYSQLKKIKKKDNENELITKKIVKYNNPFSTQQIVDMVMNLNENRVNNYNEWVAICMILVSIAKSKNLVDEMREVFHMFSKQSCKYNEIICQQKWDSIYSSTCENGLGIGSLIFKAKEDGCFKDIRDLLCDVNLRRIPIYDYSIAKAVKSTILDLYMTHREYGCYKFENTIWQKIYGCENIFKNIISDWGKHFLSKIRKEFEEYNESIDLEDKTELKERERFEKNIIILDKKLNNYASLTNIYKSLYDIYFEESCGKILFQDYKYIPFKNCVFHPQTWSIIPGNPKHYLSRRIEHDLISWDDVPQKNKEFINDFWEKIFPEKELREYCIESFARFFTGENTHKQFFFFTGDGNNGKSVLINLFQFMIEKMTMKSQKSILCGKIAPSGAANPELCRLRNAKIIIIDEASSEDRFNSGKIKLLSSCSDTIVGRDLYQRADDIGEFIPVFIPILLTNENPVLVKPDQATWNRIRLIPFKANFVDNVEEFKKEKPDAKYVYLKDVEIKSLLEENAKYFVSFFMNILFSYDSFKSFNKNENIPDVVKEGLENFKMKQNILKQFLDENYIVDSVSTEQFTLNYIMRCYNATKPLVRVDLEETRAALLSFKRDNPCLHIGGIYVRGLVKVHS